MLNTWRFVYIFIQQYIALNLICMAREMICMGKAVFFIDRFLVVQFTEKNQLFGTVHSYFKKTVLGAMGTEKNWEEFLTTFDFKCPISTRRGSIDNDQKQLCHTINLCFIFGFICFKQSLYFVFSVFRFISFQLPVFYVRMLQKFQCKCFPNV